MKSPIIKFIAAASVIVVAAIGILRLRSNAVTDQDSRPSLAGSRSGWAPLELELPQAMFEGTEKDIRVPNLRKLDKGVRPPFLVPVGTTNVALGKSVVASDAEPIIGEIDLMSDAFFGFDVLAGGTDGQNVTRPAHTMTATSSLVLRGLAAHAAPYAVDADFAEEPSGRWLLDSVEPDTTDETLVRAQLADLVLRFYGIHHEDSAQDVDDAWAVFSGALAASDDPVRAWKVTLFAMLQDIRIAYY